MDKFLKTERALALIGEEIALLEEELRAKRPLGRLENIKAIIKDLEE